MRKKRRDMDAWQHGMYTMSAMMVAVSRSMHGRKSKVQYIEEPFSVTAEKREAEENMTEAEKKAGREELLMRLLTMQEVFNANKELRGE